MLDHAQREFNIPGVTFGSRYDGSPVLPRPDTEIPEGRANLYEPTGLPGGRPPHWWFDDGRSLFDLFGLNWTLLILNGGNAEGLLKEAAKRELDLKSVSVDDPRLQELYGASLVLIRPDQIVGWRGEDCPDAKGLWDILLGCPIAAAAE